MRDKKKEYYIRILQDGCGIDYKNLIGVCPINEYYGGRHLKKRYYQVHSDFAKYRLSEFYEVVDQAVDKFLEIKKKVKI